MKLRHPKSAKIAPLPKLLPFLKPHENMLPPSYHESNGQPAQLHISVSPTVHCALPGCALAPKLRCPGPLVVPSSDPTSRPGTPPDSMRGEDATLDGSGFLTHAPGPYRSTVWAWTGPLIGPRRAYPQPDGPKQAANEGSAVSWSRQPETQSRVHAPPVRTPCPPCCGVHPSKWPWRMPTTPHWDSLRRERGYAHFSSVLRPL